MSKLKYITFDQMMSSVESDMKSFADNGMIDRGDVIKIVRTVNADIGLKINQERECVLTINNYKADLPADFLYLQMALGCTIEEYSMPSKHMFGTQTEEINCPVEYYDEGYNGCLNECGGCYWVTQKFSNKTEKYERLTPLSLTKNVQKICTDNSPNFQWRDSPYDIDIQDGELIANFRSGKIYISYLSDLFDEDGNILLLDHPLVTDYYEYAIKKRLLENFMMNNDADVAQKLMYIKEELRQARIRSMNFINTLEYTEIQKVYQHNRVRFYNRYHRIFN